MGKQLLEVREYYLRHPDDRFKYFGENIDEQHTCSICREKDALNLNAVSRDFSESCRTCVIGLQFCNKCLDNYDIRIAENEYFCKNCGEDDMGNYCSNCGGDSGESRDVFKYNSKELCPDFGKDNKNFGKYKIIEADT